MGSILGPPSVIPRAAVGSRTVVTSLVWRTVVALAFVVPWVLPRTGRAEPGALLTDDTWRYQSTGDVVVDGGLVVGFPAALPTGLAKGLGVGVTAGEPLAWGVRASWLTATESSLAWTVTHSDLKLRAVGALQAAAGRGTLGLRLGLGGTLVHESRIRNQGMRAGLTGSELESSTFRMVPAADLDAVVAIHIAGRWLLVTAGGPAVNLRAGKLHAGWSAQLGVAWQP